MNFNQLISQSKYCVISTSDLSGCSSVTPVAFVFFDSRFYFYSSATSSHVAQIRKNSKVSLVVFDSKASSSEAEAIYCSGHAKLVTTPGRQLLYKLTNNSSVSDRTLADAEVEVVRITPDKFWTNDSVKVGSVWVDRRKYL